MKAPVWLCGVSEENVSDLRAPRLVSVQMRRVLKRSASPACRNLNEGKWKNIYADIFKAEL